MEEKDRQINEFNLTIEGKIEQIDAKVLANALITLDSIVAKVAEAVKADGEVVLTVKTHKEGSFDVFLALLANGTAIAAASGMFNAHHLEMASTIIKTLTSVLNVKKLLAGKEPKATKEIEGDNYEITDNKGNITIINKPVFLIARDSKTDELVSELFANLKAVHYVDGLTIGDHEKKPLFEASKRGNDFNLMIEPTPLKEKEDDPDIKEELVEDATLHFAKVVLLRKSEGWRFIYKETPITASVKHADFIDQVVDGKIEFRNGDRLRCNLTIVKKYDKVLDTYTVKKYIVTKVHELIKRDSQESIKFG